MEKKDAGPPHSLPGNAIELTSPSDKKAPLLMSKDAAGHGADAVHVDIKEDEHLLKDEKKDSKKGSAPPPPAKVPFFKAVQVGLRACNVAIASMDASYQSVCNVLHSHLHTVPRSFYLHLLKLRMLPAVIQLLQRCRRCNVEPRAVVELL